MDPIGRLAKSAAEGRADQRDSSAVAMVDWDDLEGRSEASLLRLRTARIVRLALSVVAIPVGWLLTPHLHGLLPVLALALCAAGAIGTVVGAVLLAHVQRQIRALRYEASFGPQD